MMPFKNFLSAAYSPLDKVILEATHEMQSFHGTLMVGRAFKADTAAKKPVCEFA